MSLPMAKKTTTTSQIFHSKMAMIRDKKHLAFLRRLPCVACLSMENIQAAHIRRHTDGGTGLKPSDNFTLSLCFLCHNFQHQKGEVTFYGDVYKAIDLANELYAMSGDKERAVHRIINFNRNFRKCISEHQQ